MGRHPHESPYPVAGIAARDDARWAPLTAQSSSDEDDEPVPSAPYAPAPPAAAWLATRPILFRETARGATRSRPAPPPAPEVAPSAPRVGLLRGLRRIVGLGASTPAPLGYTPSSARAFVADLSDAQLERAQTLFVAIEREGIIDSAALADELRVPSSRLRVLVTEPLENRAAALGLERPFLLGTASPSRRRTWADRDGVAAVLAAELRAERERRSTPGHLPDDQGGSEAA